MYKTSYNKSKCQIGIVHIGYGAFHRAHQAIYIDDYMEKSGDLRWGIAAVNIKHEGFITINEYLVKTPMSYRLVRSHLQFMDWTQDKISAGRVIALPSVHVITITVTESGYTRNSPIFEYLAYGLALRASPITVICCDNMRKNGAVLETRFLEYLYTTNQPELADWVKENVSFPSCMVDRITPRTTDDLRNQIAIVYPEYRHNPIQTEEYSQWVIEDKFASHFPDLSQVGVTITDNIEPYEEAKIRILNGGHTCLAYIGALSGYTTFDQVMNDSLHREYFRQLMTTEIIPSIDICLPFDVHKYAKQVEERFANPSNVDNLERICMDGYTKFQNFVVPSLLKCLEQGVYPICIYKSIVSWYKYANLENSYKESKWELIKPLLDDIDAFVSNETLWGSIPVKYTCFSRHLKYLLCNKVYN